MIRCRLSDEFRGPTVRPQDSLLELLEGEYPVAPQENLRLCSRPAQRNQPEACSWEDAKIEPEKQPFALATDVQDLRERLQLVERFINKLPAPLKTTFAELGVSVMGQRPKKELSAEDAVRTHLSLSFARPLTPPS